VPTAWNTGYQYKMVCFTANVPTGKTFDDYSMESLRTRLNPSYMISGQETAPSTGQLHFQGYFQLPKKMSGQKILRIFDQWGIKAHLESARGTAQDNIKYCKGLSPGKTPNPVVFEFGEPSVGAGERTDLAKLAELAKSGATDQELMEANPGGYLVHQRGLGRIREAFKPVRTGPPKILVIWGPTGTGKTAAAYENGYESLDSVSITGSRFIQGYKGKDTVLFDDFDWAGMPILLFMKITDRYPVHFEVKGSEVNFNPTTMIFTSNYDPIEEWWPKEDPRTRDAMIRRLQEFGEIRMLGEEIPRGQKPARRLTDFFAAKPAAVASSAGGAGGGARVETPTTEVIDLSQDSEEEWDYDDHSQASNDAHGPPPLKRSAPTWHPECTKRGPPCTHFECFCD